MFFHYISGTPMDWDNILGWGIGGELNARIFRIQNND